MFACSSFRFRFSIKSFGRVILHNFEMRSPDSIEWIGKRPQIIGTFIDFDLHFLTNSINSLAS